MGVTGWPLAQGAVSGVDDVDVKIVEALEENPLASFRELSDVAGLSPRSVQRRLDAMMSAGIVSVVASRHPQAEDAGTWLLRIATDAGQIDELAESLAAVEGTRWVRASRDGQQLMTGLVTQPDSSGWIVDDLGRDPRVRSVVVNEILTIWNQPAMTTVRSAARPLDDIDRRLIDMLRVNARTDATELAAALHLDPSTVSRRRLRLLNERVITLLVEPDLRAFGRPVDATIWVAMAPGAIREVGARLQSLPMCRFCAAMSGTWALVLEVSASDNTALLDFVDTELSDPRITGVEIVPTGHVYKRSGVTAHARVREDGEVAAASRLGH